MKKLIGVVSAVFFVLLVYGSAFAVEMPLEETIEQETQAPSEAQIPAGEEGAAIPDGAEAPLAVWGTADSLSPGGELSSSQSIDTVKVDLSADEDGKSFMPENDNLE